MIRLALLLALPLACAPRKSSPQAAPEEPEVAYPPELQCPVGTEPAGRPPPRGNRVWCQRTLPSGQTQRHGPYLEWHATGQIAVMGAYEDGERSGTWSEWYPNGEPRLELGYVGGVEQGHYVEFHPSGEKSAEGEMVDGEEDGRWIYWSETGGYRTEGRWIMGARHGTWVEIGPDGEPVLEREYRNGRLIRHRVFR